MRSPADVDATLACLKDAARALRSNPLRTENLIVLPPKGEVMITGDLHGDVPAFDRLAQIAALCENPTRHLILQELVHGGDVPGEKCGSCLLTDKAAALVNAFPGRVHVLMGNHEMAELTGRTVIKNGVVLNQTLQEALSSVYADRTAEAQAYYAGFWRAMPLAVRTSNRLFISHTTPHMGSLDTFDPAALQRPLDDADLQRGGWAYNLLWSRDFSAEAADRLAALLDVDFFIVGHTPCPDGFRIPNHRHVVLDSMGHSAKYLILPLHGPLTLPDIEGRIRPLWP